MDEMSRCRAGHARQCRLVVTLPHPGRMAFVAGSSAVSPCLAAVTVSCLAIIAVPCLATVTVPRLITIPVPYVATVTATVWQIFLFLMWQL